MPRVFANSILSKTAQEAIEKINSSEKIATEKDKEKAVRIIKKLFSSKSKRLSTEEEAESRVDYISEHLGIGREEVIRIIGLLQEEKILANAKDLTAFIRRGENSNRSLAIVEKYRLLEEFFFSVLNEEETIYNLKELNEQAEEAGCKDTTPNKLKTLMNFWCIKNWQRKHTLEYSKNHLAITLCQSKDELKQKMERRHFLARFIVELLYRKANELSPVKPEVEEVLIEFSVLELKEAVATNGGLFTVKVTNEDVEDTLFYLSRIEAIKIEGGFLVVYNRLTIDRLEKDNRIQYKLADYQKLAQFYQSKVQQIHVVGEYARKMIHNYSEALQFVDDYFRLNYTVFLNKYFPGSRQEDIKRTLTPEKFRKLFVDNLSVNQLEIIKDNKNQHIVVAAGPGSGKTKVLVHKLASLLLTEDIKHEQLLMLTFSRAAATEFKKRLLELINKTAHYVEIKTFHSFCFDLLGKVGNLNQADSIIRQAIEKIKSGDIEPSRITKAVLVVDEAQDMDTEEFELVQALMNQNEGMRVILVGDDDQNIYGFRGADSKYMQELIDSGAVKYELTENYRSAANIVAVANQWVKEIPNRLKTLPIVPHRQEQGDIQIVQYSDAHLIMPLVEDIACANLTGTICVLTKTNMEALQVTGLLNRKGLSARMIQSNEGFNLYNLKELRFFTNLVNQQESNPVISEEEWNYAKAELKTFFAGSNKLGACLVMIDDFSRINTERKYKSDWKTFLMESKLEDFLHIQGDTIYVSTIHKAKGKEFDNVFLLLNNFDFKYSESRRELYVAITRAKNTLSIHYNGNYLQGFTTNKLTYTTDRGTYSAPPFLSYILTHKDVQLGYFAYVQRRMNGLQSGQELIINEKGLCNPNGDLVLKFSKSFQALLNSHKDNGYKPFCGSINYFVYWKDDDMDREVEIILPELELSRMENE
jgi:ATP-dependent DNA helicase RecQ